MPDEFFDVDLNDLIPGSAESPGVLSDLHFGIDRKEDMQMAIGHFDSRRRVKPNNIEDQPDIVPLNYSRAQSTGNDLYPPGSKVKVRVDVVDPFIEYTLVKNTVVVVDRIEVKGKKTRVICKDHKNALWSIPSIDVERIAAEDSQKIGRFRLLD